MGLFDWFGKRNKLPQTPQPKLPPSSPPAHSLPSISYAVAYFVLPQFAFQDCDKIIEMAERTPSIVGHFFYTMGCKLREVEPVMEDSLGFQVHCGELDQARDFFLLEYPVPPPVDPVVLEREELPVLAPHFSVIVRHRETREVGYYILGQSPMGGTTFRCVTQDGVNANLGPGPAPELDEFLDHLRASI